MKVQVVKGFAVRDLSGRMMYPVIGDIIDISVSDAKHLESRGSVIILEEEIEAEKPKPKRKVL
jgi:hypothetical protein